MNDYKKEIQRLEDDIATLKKQLDMYESLTEVQKFAITLFNNLKRNVSDSDWYYNVDDGLPIWRGHDQPRYLRLAGLLLTKYSDIPQERLIELLVLAKKYT
jgi:hypothetical protein